MSFTLAIDDELDSLLRDEAKKTGKSASDIASSLLRAALEKPKAASSTEFQVHPHSGAFAPGVNTAKLSRLADELEAEAFVEGQDKGS
jgi:negative regulator of replication initiation